VANRPALARPEVDGPEATVTGSAMVADRPWTAILNVTVPTMTLYRPKGRNTGAAIMVFPGGGYKALAIDLEGEEICNWINASGMTCALVKYRVPQDWHRDKDHEQPPTEQMGVQDARRGMGLLRQKAAELGIDPHRIGVIGFSAGGHIVAAISNAQRRCYTPVDAADAISSRPDFAIALYPGHLWAEDMAEGKVALRPGTASAPTRHLPSCCKALRMQWTMCATRCFMPWRWAMRACRSNCIFIPARPMPLAYAPA
jgi:acetyl esterase/lipase